MGSPVLVVVTKRSPVEVGQTASIPQGRISAPEPGGRFSRGRHRQGAGRHSPLPVLPGVSWPISLKVLFFPSEPGSFH